MKTGMVGLILSILLSVVTARAELKWEQMQIELHPAVGDKEAVGHFKYKNVGNAAVTIKSVHTSCGCTAAQSQKDPIAPGQTGEVTATFKIGDRTGTQVKGVTVETDDPAHPTVALVLTTVIAESLEIQPALVYWKTGEEPKAKSVSAKAGKGFPVKEIKITPVSPDFETKITKMSDSEFKIDIKPHDTTRPSVAVFSLQADKSPKIFRFTARVAGPAASKPTAAQP